MMRRRVVSKRDFRISRREVYAVIVLLLRGLHNSNSVIIPLHRRMRVNNSNNKIHYKFRLDRFLRKEQGRSRVWPIRSVDRTVHTAEV